MSAECPRTSAERFTPRAPRAAVSSSPSRTIPPGWWKNSATAQGTAQPCYGPTGATGPTRPGPPAPPRSVAATWGVDGRHHAIPVLATALIASVALGINQVDRRHLL